MVVYQFLYEVTTIFEVCAATPTREGIAYCVRVTSPAIFDLTYCHTIDFLFICLPFKRNTLPISETLAIEKIIKKNAAG